MGQKIQVAAEYISGKKITKEYSHNEFINALKKVNHGRR